MSEPSSVMELTIPAVDHEPLTIRLKAGEALFLMGANGTGKSTLIHYINNRFNDRAHFIPAHRQTWMESNSVTMSSHDKQDTEWNIRQGTSRADARFRDHYSGARVSLAIAQLLAAEAARDHDIAIAVESRKTKRARKIIRQRPSHLRTISALLQSSGMPISVGAHNGEELRAVQIGQEYGIDQLSDGERSAFLLAASILTADEGTLFLLDEPERHLHRSIASRLIASLVAKRSDCAFVISTHDITLPSKKEDAQIILLRDVQFSNGEAIAWDATLLPQGESIDDQVMRDILGSRRKLLFVEGTDGSLDIELYRIAFSNEEDIDVVPKGGHRSVESSVKAIRESGAFHWLEAFGIVDRDGRGDDAVTELRKTGVYALGVYSVESVYYHPTVQRAVAEQLGDTPDEKLKAACASAIEEIGRQRKDVAGRALERMVRRAVFERIPTREVIAAGLPVQIEVDGSDLPHDPCADLDRAIDDEDLEYIMMHYSIKPTGVRGVIARELGFANPAEYERTVRKVLRDRPQTLEFVRSLLGGLTSELRTAPAVTRRRPASGCHGGPPWVGGWDAQPELSPPTGTRPEVR